ncbi:MULTISPECIES: hypothetical protein [unclassified Streptomyces]|uniref:hypothetical protein n=1 Tax=unclassified Streptomyces TaxID=2593676 RepID=UPI00081DBB38|nr:MULTISPECIES: hypothetical protein [unclassified Streptomyces]MYZ37104.1 hypothetical protein [Streptomyces sp. SID4917]SCF88702.1 hypothetical protein GA0115259_104226 [Streptomyces sp. MnatMP-M17]
MTIMTISTSAGPITVDTTEPVAGLHVYEIPADVSPLSEYRWILAHHEGRALAAFKSFDDATKAANAVSTYADWSRNAMTAANEISFGGNAERFGFQLMAHGGQHPNA